MNLLLDKSLIANYKSNSQIARVLTEAWVKHNAYCPNCGNLSLKEFENNRPVADFSCNRCDEEFELKSKNGQLGNTIADGAYATMIQRINSNQNPNFFFLTYSKDWSVNNFLIIPKQFFTSEIILKRNPLAASAKRAGWVGCNINLSGIANAGKVFIIKNEKIINEKIVNESFQRTLFLREKNIESRGWVLEVMKSIDAIPDEKFELKDVYFFEDELKKKFPNNHFIKDKIRQQLQILRDRNIIEFLGRGKYKKIKL